MANNLGALLGAALTAGVQGQSTIAPGQSVSYRFVTAVPGIYKFQTASSGGTLTLQTTGADGVDALNPGLSGQVQANYVSLSRGVHSFRLTNTGSSPIQVSWVIGQFNANRAESLLNNAVGQDSALSLRLVTPPLPAPTSGGPTASSVLAAPASLFGAPVIPLTVSVNLVGSPTPQATQVAAVGPGTTLTTTALAANATGVLQGIGFGQALPPQETIAGAPERTYAMEVGVPPTTTGVLVATARPESPDLDALALEDAGWIRRVTARLASSLSSPSRVVSSPSTPASRIVLGRDGLERGTDNIEQASLALPLGLGAASVLAVRLLQPLRRWLGRRKTKALPLRRASTYRSPNVRF
jgi:hypothetical protein